MRFKRINEDTVRCIITEEDMIEHGVELDDFLRNRGNAREFLHEIVEQAAEEVGYEMHTGMLSMQVMPLPSNALAVTFTEQSENSLSALLENIRHAIGNLESASAERLEDLREASDEERAEAVEQFMQDIFGEIVEEDDEEEMAPVMPEERKRERRKDRRTVITEEEPLFTILRFDSIAMAENYCKTMALDRPIKSSLYKEEEYYYLLIYQGRMTVKFFQELEYMSMEYGVLMGADNMLRGRMIEHMQPVIPKSAIKVLRNL